MSEDYFRTLGVPFFAGRDFGPTDHVSVVPVAIVSDVRSEIRRPDESSGAQRWSGRPRPDNDRWCWGDTKYRSLREPAPPTVFLPARQRAEPSPLLHLVVRGEGHHASVTHDISAAITRVDEQLTFDARLLDRDVDDPLIPERLIATLSGFFGVLALLIASIGVYGLISLAVTRKQREIGVRLALGALPRTVFWMTLRDVAIVTTVGVLAGGTAALIAGRLVSALLFGLKPTDVTTLLVAVAVLAGTAALAAYVPARRASRVNPAVALRRGLSSL